MLYFIFIPRVLIAYWGLQFRSRSAKPTCYSSTTQNTDWNIPHHSCPFWTWSSREMNPRKNGRGRPRLLISSRLTSCFPLGPKQVPHQHHCHGRFHLRTHLQVLHSWPRLGGGFTSLSRYPCISHLFCFQVSKLSLSIFHLTWSSAATEKPSLTNWRRGSKFSHCLSQ